MLRSRTDFEDTLNESRSRQRTWPTLAWTGAGAAALLLAQLLGVVVYLIGMRLAHPGQFLSTYGILHNGIAVVASTLLSAVAVIPIFWGLARIRTRAVAEYLALRGPEARRAIVSVITLAVLMVALSVLSHLFEPGTDANYLRDLVSSGRTANAALLLVAAVVVAGPVSEELAFRGFLYRTLELRFGGMVALIATALGWAALHIQYSVVGMVLVFALGLYLGAVRRYSGSVYLTMLMHALWNGVALAAAMLLNGKV